MGFEALSREASLTTFIEKNKQAARSIKKNIQALGVEDRCHILVMDYRAALEKLSQQEQKYDIVYIDPPYGTFPSEEIIGQIHHHEILQDQAQIFFEEEMKKETTPIPIQDFKEGKTRKWGKTCLRQFTFNG